MQTALAVTQILVAIAMVVTAIAAIRGIKLATGQARASEAQAKSSEQLAKLSLQQTELMRTQLHASFRPVVEVIDGEHGTQIAMLTVKNVGTGPAVALCAVFRNRWRESLGSLAPDATRKFRFVYSYDLPPPPPVGPPENQAQFKLEIQPVPLRLEYT